ncbi:hypothetical protein BJ165DRAFT_1466391 [Panaeolus papilionaceus]|nr:hypothetical protein BJ165DRAFT_1466391 [Panaeolus papilionaceus]
MLFRPHSRLTVLLILLPLFTSALTIPPNIRARSSVEDTTSNLDTLSSESAQFVPFFRRDTERRAENGGTVTTEEMTPDILKQPIPATNINASADDDGDADDRVHTTISFLIQYISMTPKPD